MPANAQTQAIQVTNSILSIMQTLYSLNDQITQTSNQFTQLNIGSILPSFSTTALNPDGSLGTADQSPVSGDVIDTRVYPSLGRAVSANDIATAITLINSLKSFLSGSAVSQQGDAPQLICKLVGG